MKRLRSKLAVLTLMCMLTVTASGFKACVTDNKFNRTIAALQAAPALIESFRDSTPAEKARLKQYFDDAASALQAYRDSQTQDAWTTFLQAFERIAREHVSDSRGSARISAIISVVRIILGIPEGGSLITAQPVAPESMKDSDIKKLENLMKPIQ